VRIDLPVPDTAGGPSLTLAMATRRSVRDFTAEPLTTEELSQLLWAAQGVTSDTGKRTAPSAGATYPLEVYVVTEDGRYRYVPDGHQLVALFEGDPRIELAKAAHDQASVAEAAATFAITAVYDRTEQKYGDRAALYVKLDAGHAAQNLLLQAVALGLGGVPIGSFDEIEVAGVLNLPTDHAALYMVAIGRPAHC
jgi:SagB-type dehydrogenase family enzyme